MDFHYFFRLQFYFLIPIRKKKVSEENIQSTENKQETQDNNNTEEIELHNARTTYELTEENLQNLHQVDTALCDRPDLLFNLNVDSRAITSKLLAVGMGKGLCANNGLKSGACNFTYKGVRPKNKVGQK